uniref:hypothetical protein n=1 Tax=Vaginimicrobium propionicum TaxID=1871034 RepID=UPI001390401D|nr:hypothetical protein [Vaginimicrobium propionicum]
MTRLQSQHRRDGKIELAKALHSLARPVTSDYGLDYLDVPLCEEDWDETVAICGDYAERNGMLAPNNSVTPTGTR